MACLNFPIGLFSNITWQNGNQNTADGSISIVDNPGGGFPGMTITRSGDGSSVFIQGSNLQSITFGNRYILVLKILASAGNSDRSVTLIRTISGMPLTEIFLFTVNAPNAVALPIVSFKGDAFFIYASNGIDATNIAVRSAVDGTILCSTLPFAPMGQLVGEITATQLQIKEGGNVKSAEPLPLGKCTVSPTTRTFQDAVLTTANAIRTETFIISNTGNNCLRINGFNNVSPYSVISTSIALPATLDVGGSTMTVTVQFAPASVGTYNNIDIPINFASPVDPGSTTVLKCNGKARMPIPNITFIGNIGFSKVPLGSSKNLSITITNNGEIPITITIPSSIPGSLFTWASAAPTIAIGGTFSFPATFTPTSEGNFSTTLTFATNLPIGNPGNVTHDITLSGIGCVANAEMQITPVGVVNFGQIQRGFRTVRVFKVRNTGDGPLNFSARIQNTTPNLFGIQRIGGSVTNPSTMESFSVLPIDPCSGAAGTGEVTFGVTFFANDVIANYSNQLVIFNHNATNGLPIEIPINLQAEIIAPIAVDAELVMDRSGSMDDSSGVRRKIETAIDAGQLFVALMRPDVEDRIGIVRFNEVPELVSGIQSVTLGNQANIGNQISSANFSPTGFTCIAGGARVAIKNMDDNPRAATPAQLNSVIVVLTDGIDNRSYNDPDGNTYSLLGGGGTTALPTPANKKIYAVGIGDSIDTARLSTLAQATGGQFLHVSNFTGDDYFALEKYFTQIFMDAVDLAVIHDPVYTIQPNDKHVIPIDILNGDTGLMIVVYDRDFIRVPFYLETPSGEIVDLSSVPAGFQIRPGITNTARFIEVKFPIKEPGRYAGQWKFVVINDGKACYYRTSKEKEAFKLNQEDFGFGFQPKKCENDYNKPITYGFAIGVGSNFRMMPFVQPGITKIGDSIKLNALISEFGLPVLGCTVTVQVKSPSGIVYNYTLLDDGVHEDEESNDGNYGKIFLNTNEEGFYTFTFKALGYSHNGEPVTREAVRSKYVEGRTPVIPPNDPKSEGNNPFVECCKKMSYFLWAVLILLLFIIISKWIR